MKHEFSGEGVSESELRLILTKLHSPDDFERLLDDGDHSASISAIAEATGASVEEIEDILDEVRVRHAEARLAARFREAEESTYKVERPGHAAPDPIAADHRLRRSQLYRTILDDLVPRRVSRPRKDHSHGDRKLFNASLIIAVLFILGLLAMVAIFAARSLG